MLNGMLESSRGCLKEEIRMDIISNNLANSTVIGFKKNRIAFKQMLAEATENNRAPGTRDASQNNLMISVRTDMSQGDIRSSGNDLDLAIFGKGFFKINTENGVRYTRKGNFTLDPQGNLVTQNGNMVMGKAGPLNLSGNEIVIDGLGFVSIDGAAAGQLDIVDFEDYDGLVKEGKSLFRNNLDEPEKDLPADTRVKQGYVEISNVNVAEEMVSMIHSLRAFETYQKAIRAIDELNNQAINQVGRLR